MNDYINFIVHLIFTEITNSILHPFLDILGPRPASLRQGYGRQSTTCKTCKTRQTCMTCQPRQGYGRQSMTGYRSGHSAYALKAFPQAI
jgi:hypothetical protein